MPKPTIVILPGACHSPSHYKDLLDVLEKSGYPTTGIRNPSLGSSNPDDHTITTDAAAIREKALFPLLDDGKDVILLMHSFGGMVGSAAAMGLSKRERTSGGGIIGLVFMSCCLTQEDGSVPKFGVEKYPVLANLKESNGQIGLEDPVELLYHDVPADRAAKAVAGLKLQSKTAAMSLSPQRAWVDDYYKGRRAYILAEKDRAILPSTQEMMLDESGVEWNVKRMDTAHSPFLSHTQELADNILEIISKY